MLNGFELFKAYNRIILTAAAYAAHQSRLRASCHEYGGYAFQRIAAGATLKARDYIRAMRIRCPLTRAVHSASTRLVMQIVGHAFEDAHVLRVGRAFDSAVTVGLASSGVAA